MLTLNEVYEYLEKLMNFALAKGQSAMLSNVMDLTDMSTSMRIETSCQQTKISDFFKKD